MLFSYIRSSTPHFLSQMSIYFLIFFTKYVVNAKSLSHPKYSLCLTLLSNVFVNVASHPLVAVCANVRRWQWGESRRAGYLLSRASCWSRGCPAEETASSTTVLGSHSRRTMDGPDADLVQSTFLHYIVLLLQINYITHTYIYIYIYQSHNFTPTN